MHVIWVFHYKDKTAPFEVPDTRIQYRLISNFIIINQKLVRLLSTKINFYKMEE